VVSRSDQLSVFNTARSSARKRALFVEESHAILALAHAPHQRRFADHWRIKRLPIGVMA
jgi:hypothetical protein